MFLLTISAGPLTIRALSFAFFSGLTEEDLPRFTPEWVLLRARPFLSAPLSLPLLKSSVCLESSLVSRLATRWLLAFFFLTDPSSSVKSFSLAELFVEEPFFLPCSEGFFFFSYVFNDLDREQPLLGALKLASLVNSRSGVGGVSRLVTGT
eukprot:GHVT01034011.1.p1 GENE.GHVT01034011.1~~GHVT01034011.1.p1  ORF type:complete len:151 (+),score=4.07 GHVT01034011.1:168-620(+)